MSTDPQRDGKVESRLDTDDLASGDSAALVRGSNRITFRKLIVIVVAMFGFGYALVPFYKKICEATGIQNLLNPDRAAVSNTQVDASRTIVVEFDASIRKLAWDFK